MNNVELNGKICQQKAITTSTGKTITSFSLNFYNGKKDGKSQYAFIDCKMFSAIDIDDKSNVACKGWLGSESWEKDGKKYSRIVFYVKEIEVVDNKISSEGRNLDEGVDIFPDKDVEPNDDFGFTDDEIPF